MANARDAILELLADDGGWLYGMELIKRSDGRIGRATVYVHLDVLEEAGQVESRQEDPVPAVGLPRRQYRITHRGRLVLAGDPGLVLA